MNRNEPWSLVRAILDETQDGETVGGWKLAGTDYELWPDEIPESYGNGVIYAPHGETEARRWASEIMVAAGMRTAPLWTERRDEHGIWFEPSATPSSDIDQAARAQIVNERAEELRNRVSAKVIYTLTDEDVKNLVRAGALAVRATDSTGRMVDITLNWS